MEVNDKTVDQIDQLLTAHRSQGFSGCVAIFNGIDVVHEQAVQPGGMPEVSLTTRTAFGLASAGKLFTALAVFRLAEMNLLDLQASAQPHLPASIKVPQEVTIWHLMTHTSGIEEFFDESACDGFGELWRQHPVYGFRQPNDYLPLLAPLSFSSCGLGKFSYKNSAYILLGLIVEKISGQPFIEFVEQQIITRAGLESSGYFDSDNLPPHAVHGFLPGGTPSSWRTNIFAIPPRGGGEGGLYCSPRDMATLWNAIARGEVIGELTSRFLEPQVQDGCDGEWHYAFGYWINRVRGAVRYVSVGEDPGCSVRFSFDPVNQTGIGVFCNVGSRAGAMSVDLHKLLYPTVHRSAVEPATLRTCSTALCDGVPERSEQELMA